MFSEMDTDAFLAYAKPHHQVLRDAPGFSHGEVSRCLRSRQSIWCSPQGWDTPGFSHGEEVTGTSATDQALDQVPRIGRDYDWRVTPREFVRVLDTHPDFPKAVDAITAPETIAAALGALTEAGARLYLANALQYPLIFIHAV